MKLHESTLAILVGILLLKHPAFSQEKAQSTATVAKISPPTFVKWKDQAQIEQTRKEVFAYLSGKVGRQLEAPKYPKNALIGWSMRSYQKAGDNSDQLYVVIYEQLLVAEQLFKDKETQQERRALRVCHNALFKIGMRLRDRWLAARVSDGFIFPHINAAQAGKGTLSQARLIQDAASAFRLANEGDKQAKALKILIEVAEENKDIDVADWARVKLADVLAVQGHYQEAAEHLKAVTSPNMSGSKNRIAELQAKATKAKGAASK